MKKQFIALWCLPVVVLSTVSSLRAQTPPTPTTTFTQADGNRWTNAANWDVQIPTTNAPADDALIDDGQTAYYDQTVDGDPQFGTLTLGSGSTFQFKAGNSLGIPSGYDVYFSDGSTLEFTAGSSNRDPDFFVIPGAAATWITAGNTFFRGSLQGAGDFTVVMKGTVESRVNASGFTGDLTYESNNGTARQVSRFGRFGGTTQAGSGITTFSNAVYLFQETGDRMHDSATIKLVGGTGGAAAPKWRINTETIRYLLVESPLNLTGSSPLLGGSAQLTVSDTVTFQGTGSTVEIDDDVVPPAGNTLSCSNLTFAGTGSWEVSGDGMISINAGTISNSLDVTISNPLTAASGFTKTGSGTLTLGDPAGVETEINLSNGSLVFSTNANLTGSDYVTFGNSSSSFTADFGGSFADIDAVGAAIGASGNFRLHSGVSGALWEYDNEDGSFCVAVDRIIVNRDPTGVLNTTAALNGEMKTPDTNYNVYVHWGSTDGTNNISSWSNSAYLGAWTNVSRTNFTHGISSLTAETTYYFTFRATNETTNVWASPSLSFTTLDMPVVDNATGATPVDATSATLSGELTAGATAAAWICWGTNDAGTVTTSDWDNVESIGSVATGIPFSTNADGLATNQTYWYRCFATNALGTDWSDEATTFNGTPTGGGGPWTPEELTLAAWFDASDTGTITESSGSVSQWNDKSGNGNHVTAGASPVSGTRNVNLLNVIDFDNNDYLENSANITTQPYSYAIIAGIDNAGQDNTLFDGNGGQRSLVRHKSGSTVGMYAGAWGPEVAGPATGDFLASGTFNGASSEIRVNGGTAGTGNPNSGGLSSGITIGNNDAASTTYDHDGIIGEIVIGSGVWNPAERQQVEGYLAHKWNITLASGHPYEDDPPGGSGAIANLAPTNILVSWAVLNASLNASANTNYAVYVHFGTADGGTNFGWGSGYSYVGSWTNSSSTSETCSVSFPKGGLMAETAYWYTFRSSNDSGSVWAYPSWSFTTPPASGAGSVFMFR